MTTYYLHYGFDWNSYTIGTVWGATLSEGGSKTTLSGNSTYWLQSALTNSQDGPWASSLFNFQSGDSLYFVVWDLTQWREDLTEESEDSTPDLPNLDVRGYLALNAPDGAAFTEELTLANNLKRCTSTSDQTYISFSVQMSYPAPKAPPGAPQNTPLGARASGCGSNTLGPLTISINSDDSDKRSSSIGCSIIMNFCLEIFNGKDETTRFYVAEPEAYIGSGKTQ